MSVQLTNHIAVMHRQIEELKCHMNVRRTKISEAAEQLMQYVVEHEQRDYLVVKPPDNPYKPKSSCLVL